MYKMSKFFYGFMIFIICLLTGFLISTGTGEGLEYVLALVVAIAGGSFCYDKFVKHGEF